jgi:hypothetical protein
LKIIIHNTHPEFLLGRVRKGKLLFGFLLDVIRP